MKWVLVILNPTGNKAYEFSNEDVARQAMAGFYSSGKMNSGAQCQVIPLEKP